jgi:thiamine-monophosphate kinase
MGRGLDPRTLGELGLIDVIRRRARQAGGVWVKGIGDDAAVLRPRPGRELVLTTDALVEDVHFRWSTMEAKALGRKTLAVSLSDIGAMGARPLGCMLTLGLPRAARPGCVEGVLKGLLSEARASDCPLIGGDTVASGHWMLSVTVIGEVPRGRALGRDGARAGERLLVTGELGSAALGLILLETGRAADPASRRFVKRHRSPSPPYRVGPRLVRARLASAAIDLSDGLAADLDHLLAESGLGADIHLDRLPFARGMRQLSQSVGMDPQLLALHGGEDYELLFSVPARAPSATEYTRRLGCRVTELGVLRAGRRARYLRDGHVVSVTPKGFDHFKPVSRESDK